MPAIDVGHARSYVLKVQGLLRGIDEVNGGIAAPDARERIATLGRELNQAPLEDDLFSIAKFDESRFDEFVVDELSIDHIAAKIGLEDATNALGRAVPDHVRATSLLTSARNDLTRAHDFVAEMIRAADITGVLPAGYA